VSSAGVVIFDPGKNGRHSGCRQLSTEVASPVLREGLVMRTKLTLSRLVLASTLAALPVINACAATSDDIESGEGAASAPEKCPESECPRLSGPKSELTYDDLLALQKIDGKWQNGEYTLGAEASKELVAKVNDVLKTPVISNEAFHDHHTQKFAPTIPEFGEQVPTIRSVAWNIERGENLAAIQEMLQAAADAGSREKYLLKLQTEREFDKDPAKRQKQVDDLKTELEAISKVDVFILNEVDNGMVRSGLKDVVRELAGQLKMNYAYGVEFIEVDPISLGNETFEEKDFKTYDAKTKKEVDVDDLPEAERAELKAEATRQMNAVQTQMRAKRGIKALHGNAILSRYPIKKNVRIGRFETKTGAKPTGVFDFKKAECWDWNHDEKQKSGFLDGLLEQGQNLVAQALFLEKSQRQIRHGGRFFMAADLVVNGLDNKGVTVINAHLEAKGTPKCRRDQMQEVLATVDAIENPIIMGGDLNTSGQNGTPQTVNRLLFDRFKNPEFWVKQIVNRAAKNAIPWIGWVWTAFDVFRFVKAFNDPTSRFHPEGDKKLFSLLGKSIFEHIEDHGFDFRSNPIRTVKTEEMPNGTDSTLANSNQRAKKGFKVTFSVERPLLGFIGKAKLDWIFVRPFASLKGENKDQAKKLYRMAPHFPRTLENLNNAPSHRMSDHFPLVVTLPLIEPCLGKKPEECKLPPADPTTVAENFDLSLDAPAVPVNKDETAQELDEVIAE
jgi:endonuclease/exonuclease/phosphatase family metal-dependent hydrolase